MNFADQLRQERLKRGISQEALAETLGVSPRTICRWEQGQAVPQAILRVKLGSFLHLSPETLFGEHEQSIPHPQADKDLADGLYDAPPQPEDSIPEEVQSGFIPSADLPQQKMAASPLSRQLLRRRNVLVGLGVLGTATAGASALWYAFHNSVFVQESSPKQAFPLYISSSQLSRHLLDPNISNWINRLDWSPDGSTLAVASGSNAVTFWNIEKEVVLLSYSTLNKWVNDVSWSKTNWIAAATADLHAGSLEIWKFPEQKPAFLLQRKYALRSVDWSPDGSYVAVSGHTSIVEVWNPFAARRVSQYTDATLGLLGINRVKWSPSGQYLACATDDGTVHIWEALTGKPQMICRGHQSRVHDLSWSPDGRFIVSAGADTTSRIWEVSSGRTLVVYRGQTGEIEGIDWSPPGHSIASASADQTVHVWLPLTGKAIAIYGGYRSIVETSLWSADGTRLATGTNEEGIKIWQAPRL